MIASSQLRSGSRISLPREHGGYLALLAAAVSGIAIAPRPWAALGVGLVVTSAFLLRGPVERASHAPLRAWDAPMSGLLVGVGFGGVWLAGPDWPAPMLLLALGLPACTAWARRHRLGRHPGFELLSMAGLGVAGGAVAWFGGASAPTAAALALCSAYTQGSPCRSCGIASANSRAAGRGCFPLLRRCSPWRWPSSCWASRTSCSPWSRALSS